MTKIMIEYSNMLRVSNTLSGKRRNFGRGKTKKLISLFAGRRFMISLIWDMPELTSFSIRL